MPYGQDVPILHASAAMQRIAALGYLLVWSWQEHLRACKTLDTEPADQVVFLVDETEAHLHPRWQRRIVPAGYPHKAGRFGVGRVLYGAKFNSRV
jgi:hypothetical protein